MRPAFASPTVRAQFRPWPRDATTCHLALLDMSMVPSRDDVAGWVNEITAGEHDMDAPGFTTVRTGALFAGAAEAFIANGFREIDRLALLDRPLLDPPGPRPTPPTATWSVRMRDRDLPAAAAVDATAFDATWSNDATSLDDIARATPQSRRRMVVADQRRRRRPSQSATSPLGFSITGRAGDVGYIQRLAVDPASRRRGVATFLVDDACRWLTQRGATKVLVNTGVTNHAARALYERCGFRVASSELVVLELELDAVR